MAFGAKFSVLRVGKLAVGDEVTVTFWAKPELQPGDGLLPRMKVDLG